MFDTYNQAIRKVSFQDEEIEDRETGGCKKDAIRGAMYKNYPRKFYEAGNVARSHVANNETGR